MVCGVVHCGKERESIRKEEIVREKKSIKERFWGGIKIVPHTQGRKITV